MDFIKQLLPSSFVQSPAPAQIKKKSYQFKLLPQLDYCNRYRPLFDKKTFQEQLALTEGELINYFDSSINEQYYSYINTSKYITYGFWAVSIGFAVFCHKINLLNRMLGQKTWKMFSFKFVSICAPFYLMERVMPQAQEQEINILYSKCRDKYMCYKLTGDITQLGSRIQLIDQNLSPLEDNTKLETLNQQKQDKQHLSS